MRLRVAALFVALLVVAGCGTSTSPRATTTSRPTVASTSTASTTTPSTTSTTAPHTASEQLALFFAAAEQTDAKIRTAAELVNGDIGGTTMRFDQQTIDAVHAIDIDGLARTIPPGMPEPLRHAVFLVYSDLSSRRAAFNRIDDNVSWDDSGRRSEVIDCLRNGAVAAAHFADDVTAARAAAVATPPFVVGPPSSRAAAEVALWADEIRKGNNGCDSCGGYRQTGRLSPIVWHRVDTGNGMMSDGTIGGLNFDATYAPATGWKVNLWAC